MPHIYTDLKYYIVFLVKKCFFFVTFWVFFEILECACWVQIMLYNEKIEKIGIFSTLYVYTYIIEIFDTYLNILIVFICITFILIFTRNDFCQIRKMLSMVSKHFSFFSNMRWFSNTPPPQTVFLIYLKRIVFFSFIFWVYWFLNPGAIACGKCCQNDHVLDSFLR